MFPTSNPSHGCHIGERSVAVVLVENIPSVIAEVNVGVTVVVVIGGAYPEVVGRVGQSG